MGMAWVMSASDDSVEVWSVSDDVPSGSPVETGSLTEVRIAVPDPGVYVSTDVDRLPPGAVASQRLRSR